METAAQKNCKIEGCKRAYRSKGYCNVHFKKWRQGELPQKPRYKTCGAENCLKPMSGKGLCEEHLKEKTAKGVPPAPTPVAAEAPKEEAKSETPEEKKE